MAEQVLRCEKCNRRFRTRSHDPQKCYSCPGCNVPLRLESSASPDTPAQTIESDGDASGDPLVGRQIGPYRILSKLGEGGMGAVYKAQHVDLRRFSALKILPEGKMAKSPKAVQRFMREARSAAVLSHPNIVTVCTVGEAGGHRFIDMEFVEGESVQDRLRQEGRFSVGEATRIIRDAATALAEAHAANIVHRDIKPGNILLSQKGTVKVADFGLAKDVEQDSLVTQEGKGGLGTPCFMSPEQCDGLELDGRADIYSLGVTYFYLLTGDLPFKASSVLTVMLKHKTEPPPDPRTYVPALPEAACAIIERCLAKDPNERYQTCEELLADLEGMPVDDAQPMASQRPPVAGPSADISQARAEADTLTGPTPMAAASRVRKVVVGGIGLAVVGIAAVFYCLAVRSPKSERTAEDAEIAKTTMKGAKVTKKAVKALPSVAITETRAPTTEQPTPSTEAVPSARSVKSAVHLPRDFESAFTIPDSDKDQHGNPVVTHNGSKSDPKTGYPYEIWLRGPRMEFVLIPAGEFMMGREDGPDDEKPMHRVRITKCFYFGKCEVTQSQYGHLIDKNPSAFKGSNRPVDNVGRKDATSFCRKLSERIQVAVRLPTEAEWEYASRAGTKTRYSLGDDANEVVEYGWHAGNSGRQSHPVGQKKANPWGLYDMHGNLWEWCSDWYTPTYYEASPVDDPQGPPSARYRVRRGGGWGSTTNLECSVRSSTRTNWKHNSYGFRVVVELPPSE